MADVKWIKITTDIFDDEKILIIESMPSADSIIVIWFKLLAFAGKQNNNGVFLMSNRIAYTEELLSAIFRRDVKLIRLALDAFVSLGMIEIIDNVITIPNWNKHQTLDSYEKKKERDRLYQAERRANQRALIAQSSDKSSDSKTIQSSDVAISEEDIERDIEEDNKKNNIKKKTSPKETNTTLFERIYLDYCLSENLISKLREWMKYKSERKDEYAEQGLRTLLRRIENKYLEFGKQDTTICELIDESMSNLWKGIIFDRLKAPAQTETKGSFDTDEFFDLAMKKSYSQNPRTVLERQAVARMETKKEPQTVDAERLEALKQRLAK